MAIAVPGEVSGFHTIWKKYGKLPWAALVEPSIKLARYGFPLPPPVEGAMKRSEAKIRADPGLRWISLFNSYVYGSFPSPTSYHKSTSMSAFFFF